VNSPPPKPEVILTNFFAEPTVLLVPITSRDSACPKKMAIKTLGLALKSGLVRLPKKHNY
jgi:hypothetical protein